MDNSTTNRQFSWEVAVAESRKLFNRGTSVSEADSLEKTSKEIQRRLDEIEVYAAIVHIGMALGYLFTIPYHVKRKDKNLHWLALHLTGAGYHTWAASKHLK